jgi:hypothetical protein
MFFHLIHIIISKAVQEISTSYELITYSQEYS